MGRKAGRVTRSTQKRRALFGWPLAIWQQKGGARSFCRGPCSFCRGVPVHRRKLHEKKAYSAAPPSSMPGCTAAAWKRRGVRVHACGALLSRRSWGSPGRAPCQQAHHHAVRRHRHALGHQRHHAAPPMFAPESTVACIPISAPSSTVQPCTGAQWPMVNIAPPTTSCGGRVQHSAVLNICSFAYGNAAGIVPARRCKTRLCRLQCHVAHNGSRLDHKGRAFSRRPALIRFDNGHQKTLFFMKKSGLQHAGPRRWGKELIRHGAHNAALGVYEISMPSSAFLWRPARRQSPLASVRPTMAAWLLAPPLR